MQLRYHFARLVALIPALNCAAGTAVFAQSAPKAPFTAADALDISTAQIADLSVDGRWLLVTTSSRRDGLGVDYRRDTDPTYLRLNPARLTVIDTRDGTSRDLFPTRITVIRGALTRRFACRCAGGAQRSSRASDLGSRIRSHAHTCDARRDVHRGEQ